MVYMMLVGMSRIPFEGILRMPTNIKQGDLISETPRHWVVMINRGSSVKLEKAFWKKL